MFTKQKIIRFAIGACKNDCLRGRGAGSFPKQRLVMEPPFACCELFLSFPNNLDHPNARKITNEIIRLRFWRINIFLVHLHLSGFQLSLGSVQATTLVLVLFLLRFQVGCSE